MPITAMSPISTQSHSPFSDIVVLEIANADAGKRQGVTNNDDANSDAAASPSHTPPLPVRLFKVKRCRCEEHMSPPGAPIKGDSRQCVSPHESRVEIPTHKRARTMSFALQPVRFDMETGSWDISSEERVRISPSKQYVTSAYDGQSLSLDELLAIRNGGDRRLTNHRSENPSSDSGAASSSNPNPNGISFSSTCVSSGQNTDTM